MQRLIAESPFTFMADNFPTYPACETSFVIYSINRFPSIVLKQKLASHF
jgi:hypothetical protein